MRRAIAGTALVMLLLMVLFLFYGVWPTLYRYDIVRIGGTPNQLVRTNRITGNAQVLSRAGWISLEAPDEIPTPNAHGETADRFTCSAATTTSRLAANQTRSKRTANLHSR